MARHWLRLAVGTWLVLAAVVAVRILISPGSHTVFPIFAASAAHWWANQSLYSWDPPLDLFRYPPLFAVAVTPFGALGLRAGGILWIWLGMAVYAIGLWRFARDVLPPKWTDGRAAAFLALGAVVALPGLWNAQSNTLVVGLLLLAASDISRRYWWTASLLLATAIWIKVTPVVPALLLCALWPRRLAPRLAVALAVGALLPFLTRPPDLVLDRYVEWVVAMTRSSEARWPGFRDAWTAWVAVRHFFQGNAGPLPLRRPIDWAGYPALQLGAAAGTLAWCLWQQRRQTDPRRLLRLTLAIGMAWLMLFGPAVEHPTYAFLAPFLAWALLERRTWPIVTSFVLIAVFGWQPLVSPLLGRLPFLLSALPVGTALFTAWLIDHAQRVDPAFRASPESGAIPIESAN